MPRKTKHALRQTTLFDSPRTSRKSKSSSEKLSPSKQRRTNALLALQQDDDSDQNGLGAIKLEPKMPVEKGTKDTHRPLQGKRGRNLDEDTAPKVQRKRLTRKRQHSSGSDAEESPPRRRRLAKGRKNNVETSESEDIAAEVDKDRIVNSRLRTRNKMTAFQKNLERLKRRKQGKPLESSSNSQEDESETEEPIKGARPTTDYDSLFDEASGDDEDGQSSDFIVDDEEGAPLPSLPLQFSMEMHEDVDHQFKKIFQFFVHIAVRPAKERHDFMEEQLRREEYFSVPLQVVRRKLTGLRDSLVTSSTWRPEFKKPLDTYPEFDLVPLDFAVPSCNACHLGGRMSTLVGRLSGLPYDRLGFEVLDECLDGDNGSESGGDSDGSDQSNSSGKSTKPSATVKEFHLGRFCAKRTRVYHEFTHWEHDLFKCIRDEVDDLHASKQSGGFYRIAYAGGKRPPKDLDDGDGICEWLDERKVIDMQWQKIKAMMESARHLELASKGNDDD